MTLTDIKQMNTDFLTPDIVAQVIGCDPQSVRNQAQADHNKLGFPVMVIGKRTLIPRDGFIFFCTFGKPCP